MHADDSIDLGDHYRFVQDYPPTIIYHESEVYEGIGSEVVPPPVHSYAYNKVWIIARSKSQEDKQIGYWIIDKRHDKGKAKPMDSLTFFSVLQEKAIKLKFE